MFTYTSGNHTGTFPKHGMGGRTTLCHILEDESWHMATSKRHHVAPRRQWVGLVLGSLVWGHNQQRFPQKHLTYIRTYSRIWILSISKFIDWHWDILSCAPFSLASPCDDWTPSKAWGIYMASTHRGCRFESIVANNIMGHSLQPLLTASLACGKQLAMNYGSERHLIAKRKVKYLYEVRYSNTVSRLACFTQKDIWWEVFLKAPLRTLPAARFRRARAIRLLRCKCLVRSFARALPNLGWPITGGKDPLEIIRDVHIFMSSTNWDPDYHAYLQQSWDNQNNR